MISHEIIEEVREANDIVEVLSSYLSLKRAGRNYKALCPFHQEKTPSFIISPEKQIYHCFGCGEGGNVFSFVMKMESLPFQEAVKLLAERAGIKIESSPWAEEGDKKRYLLLQSNSLALSIFQKFLKSEAGKEASSYLKKRNLDEEIVEKFKLGFAPGNNLFLEEMKKRDESRENLLQSGLVTERDGLLCPLFRNRLIFPILNQRGECLGFGGRTLDESQPKYLNSPETVVFNKGHLLYGLNLSSPEISREKSVYLVEGYVDSIKLYQAGFKNVAASLGTAFTTQQSRILRRFTKKVVLLFDPDIAGRKAAIRNLEILIENGFGVKVLSLPEGFDPDRYIDQFGPDSFSKLVPQDPFDYRLDILLSEYDKETVDGKNEIVENIIPFLIKFESQISQDEYLKRMSKSLDVELDALREHLKIKKSSKGKESSFSFQSSKKSDALLIAQEDIISLILEEASFLKEAGEKLRGEDFSDSLCHRIYQEIMNLAQRGEKAENKRLLAILSPDEELSRKFAYILYQREIRIPEGFEGRYFKDCLNHIIKERIKKEKAEILSALKDGEEKGSFAPQLLSKYEVLRRKEDGEKRERKENKGAY